jgi:TrmH family RNA methyltransferase
MTFGDPITSRTNARVKALRASFSGKARLPGELAGVEGEHLISEALRSGLSLDTVFVRAGSEATLDRLSLSGLQADHVVLLSSDVFNSVVETESPQGIAATVATPDPYQSTGDWLDADAPVMNSYHRRHGTFPPILVLESLQDPGNVGTLLRSAEAFGVSWIIMTSDGVNPWNPKAIRASAGSIFRVHIMRFPLESLRKTLMESESESYAAVAPGQGGKSLFATNFDDAGFLIVGNEGSGISAETLALAKVRVTIPCKTESLNAAVAGSVLLYEAMRQRFVGGKPNEWGGL